MKAVFLVCMLCVTTLSIAQSDIDSILVIWENESLPDSIRLNAIETIAWDGFLFTQPDSASYYAQLQLSFAKSKGLKKYMASALKTQGVSAYLKGTYARAIEYYSQCLEIYQEINYEKGVAASLNNIGLVYSDQGNYSIAIEYYVRSMNSYEKMKNREGMAISLNNVGLLHNKLGNYASSIECHTKSLAIRTEMKNDKGIAASLNNIGLNFEDQGNYEQASDYYFRSLKIKREINDKQGVATTLTNIGTIYQKIGDSRKALDYYSQSLTIREEIGNRIGIASSLGKIGAIYNETNDYSKAIKYASRALNVAKQIGATAEIRDAANVLSEAYKASGKYKLAFEMYGLYVAEKDSILSEKNQREVVSRYLSHEYEKRRLADSLAYVKEKKVKDALLQVREVKLEKMRIQQVVLIAGIVIALVFIGLIFNRFQVIKKQKLIIYEQNKELGNFNRIVSHDLKAPLGGMQALLGYIKSDIDSRNYSDLPDMVMALTEQVSKMKNLIDDILEYSAIGQIEGESRVVDCNVLIRKIADFLIIPETVSMKINEVLPTLKISEVQISQVFQNLISNAIKYMDKEGGKITIGYQERATDLMFYIEDNGIGIDEKYHEKIFQIFQIVPRGSHEQTGIGLSIVKKIIEMNEGRIWVTSELGVGSTFYFTLPKKCLSVVNSVT